MIIRLILQSNIEENIEI